MTPKSLLRVSFMLVSILFGTMLSAAEGKKAAEIEDSEKPLLLNAGMLEASSIIIVGVPSAVDFGTPVCAVAPAPAVSFRPPSRLEINVSELKPQWIRVTIPAVNGSCSGNTRFIDLFLHSAGTWSIPEGSLTIWYDSAVAEFTSTDVRGYQLVPLVNGKTQQPGNCSIPMNCSFNTHADFLKELSANSGKATVLIVPANVPLRPGEPFPLIITAAGAFLDRLPITLSPKKIIFNRSLIDTFKLDAAANHQELSVRYADAIDQVSCDSAECRMTQDGLRIFAIDQTASFVHLRYTLKPRFFIKLNEKLVTTETVRLNIERCNIKIPEHVPLLAGVENHHYFLQFPRECITQDIRDLQLQTRPPSQAYLKSELKPDDPSMRLVEIVFDRIPAGIDQLHVSLLEHAGGPRLIGSVLVPVLSQFTPSFIKLSVENLGQIDFIPSNRFAQLRLGAPSSEWETDFKVEDRTGFYTVARQESHWTIRGESAVTGNVPLRIAYRPQELLQFIKQETEEPVPPLVIFDSAAVFPIRTINIPLPLLPAKNQSAQFVQVLCGKNGKERDIEIGELARIEFETRDSCRIVFDQGKISESAGTQRLHVTAGDFNQIIALSPGNGPLTLTIPVGNRTEYDTLVVVIAHDLLSGHYTLQARQNLGEEARYRILLSKSWLRIAATTALPTGMFRFGSGSVQGTVPISAGALVRASYMQKNGRDFPLGLEAGLFGTNLSGQPDLSLVTGFGLSIPVLNPNTSLQASFNINIWLEYAPTRPSRGDGAFAFLFGPSFTVGQLSTTF